MNINEMQQLLATAEKYQQTGELAKATEAYDRLLKQTQVNYGDTNRQQIRLTALAAQTNLLTLQEKYHEGMDLCEIYVAEADTYQHRLSSLLNLGNNATHAGFYRRAIAAGKKALELGIEYHDEAGKAQALGLLASAYAVLGRLEEAITHFQKSIALFEKLEDMPRLANTWNRLGLAYQQRGMLDKAIQCHKRHLELVQQLSPHNATMELLAFNNLGENYLILYHTDKAIACFQQGMALQAEIERVDVIADLYRNQGVAYCQQYRVQAGLGHLHHAWELGQQSTNFILQLQILYSLTLAELQANHLDEAFRFGELLYRRVEENNIYGHKSRALHVLGLYYRQIGDLNRAKQMWEESLFLAHENHQRFLRWQLHGELASIATTPGLRDVHLQIAREIIEQIVEPIGNDELRQHFLNAPPVQAILI